MCAVQVGVGLGESAVLGLEIFQLLFEMLDMLLLALAESALRGAVLGAAALERVLGPGAGDGRGFGQTYNAHVGDGFFVLGGGGAPSSSVLMLGSGEVHKFDRVDNGGLMVEEMRSVGGVDV